MLRTKICSEFWVRKQRLIRLFVVVDTLKPGFHIVVSVVSVVSVIRKKFIGPIEFILVQQVVSVISFVLSICTGGFHKVLSVL